MNVDKRMNEYECVWWVVWVWVQLPEFAQREERGERREERQRESDADERERAPG